MEVLAVLRTGRRFDMVLKEDLGCANIDDREQCTQNASKVYPFIVTTQCGSALPADRII